MTLPAKKDKWISFEKIVSNVFEENNTTIRVGRIILSPYNRMDEFIDEYLFWGWCEKTTIEGDKKDFVYGGFRIVEKKVTLTYAVIDYVQWAALAYQEGFLDVANVKQEDILI